MSYATQQNIKAMCGHHWQGGEKILLEVVAEEVSVQLWDFFLFPHVVSHILKDPHGGALWRQVK